jgi:hypothetical protein
MRRLFFIPLALAPLVLLAGCKGGGAVANNTGKAAAYSFELCVLERERSFGPGNVQMVCSCADERVRQGRPWEESIEACARSHGMSMDGLVNNRLTGNTL